MTFRKCCSQKTLEREATAKSQAPDPPVSGSVRASPTCDNDERILQQLPAFE
jgi:hypothetical protein